jgi:GNAT superfamily N-acetyltransferase
MIRFENYQYCYYQQVCDFLIEINKENNYHNNWNWARFEWMHEHPSTKKELLSSMGLWFDDNRLVGAALFDMFFGEAFVGVLNDYHDLYQEVLSYAFNNLKDDRGLGVAFHDENIIEISEAIKQGFYKVETEEIDCAIELKNDFPIFLLDDFSIETYDAQKNPQEIEWLFWQGFDHGNNVADFLNQYKELARTRPHFNPLLCIVIKNKQGELVASASTWYNPVTDYAYLEPVCVIPPYRKLGLGKAVVYYAMNQARKLGAKRVIVNSGQEFYKRIGFKMKSHYSFYWKKEERIVNGVTYKIERLLGKGKGGYSYLAKANDKEYVLKQIHHEPCEYYHFGNKIEAEKNDYQRLLDAKIRIPKMIDIDMEKEIIIKEYIEGDVIADLIKEKRSVKEYIPQLKEMARLAKDKGLNIDYYPTNFVCKNGLLYYIDFECNSYMDKWNLENWGIKYWNEEKKL